MAVPYTFGTATAAIPLSNLDSNFATPITLGNTAIQLGNTVTTLNNMTLANVAVTSVSTAFPNNLLANSSVTLGNTTVALGGTATTLGNVTLTNATVSSLSTAITVAQGGTGLTSTPANGALDIGNGTGFTRTTLTAGSGISITNGAGSISIATSGGAATSIANGTSNVSIATSGGNVVVATNGNTAVTVDTSQNATFAGYINAPNTFGFKNRIINGAMVIDQRNAGASQTFTAAAALAYAVDRWYGYCTGANVTGQQIAGGTTPTVTQNRYRFTGAASVTAVGFGQRIEQKNSYDLAGSTCTLSADLAISATLTTVTWTAYYATTTADTFGSLASPTVTQIATGTFTVSATVTNFSANISVPAAATTGIQILFTVGALTAGLTWTIGNVQLEKGSTATSFDYRSIGTELALCQRYYQSYMAPTTFPLAGVWRSSTRLDVTGILPVEMRSAPTATQVGTIGNITAYGNAAGGGIVLTAWNSLTLTSKVVSFYNNVAAGGFTGGGAIMDVSVTGTGYTLSSEL